MALPTTATALKPCVLKALQGASSLHSPEAMLELQQEVLQDISIQLGITQAPFTEPLIPPPLTQESDDTDIIHHLAAELNQVTFPITFKSLCVTLASLGTANYHYLQDTDYAAHHGIYDLMECTWDQLHPYWISLAPFPVDIPPTPSSHSGSPFVPSENIIPHPLPSCDVNLNMIDADCDSSSEDSHEQMPMPCPLEKGKMHQVDPITPSPLPVPSPAPIELVAPAATADAAVAMVTGKKKGKKVASFASVAAKAASKPGGVEPPHQQTKIT